MSCNKCQKSSFSPPSHYGAPPPPPVMQAPYVPRKEPVVFEEIPADQIPPMSSHFHAPTMAHARSMRDVQIAPCQAFDVMQTQSPEFLRSLVSVAAAKTVKGFCAEGTPVPVPECPDCEREIPGAGSSGHCANPCAERDTVTDGHELGACWMDQRPVQKMVLFGRAGRFLSRLVGEGALWLGADGLVSVVKQISLSVTNLWHRWFSPDPQGDPVMGQPMPFPYQVIADVDGRTYAIQGLSGEDSISVWDAGEMLFYQRPLSSLNPDAAIRKKLPGANRLELVGFDVLPVSGNATDLRKMKRLEGEGMLWLHKVQTAAGSACDCGNCPVAEETTVAEFIPNPVNTGNCPMVMAFLNGKPQWMKATDIECLQGAQGNPGIQGPPGADGKNGSVTTYNGCGC